MNPYATVSTPKDNSPPDPYPSILMPYPSKSINSMKTYIQSTNKIRVIPRNNRDRDRCRISGI